ncbi:hypothetical protein AB205_0035590, partial [Aquarana catesbeiana]
AFKDGAERCSVPELTHQNRCDLSGKHFTEKSGDFKYPGLLMEVTGKNQDECLVALHDCNGDVNRAINILLEGNSDTTSWETVGGKKKIGKEGSENKENREKRGDRELFPFRSIDLVALLQKPQTNSTETESAGFESTSQQNFGQALVFTNSQHSSQITSTASSTSAVNSYTPQSLSSVLGSGFGELGTSKLTNSAGSQILEQLKSPGLGQFSTQNSQQSGSNATPSSSWDIKPSAPQSSVLSQFDFKSQPEPSPVLSQLAQRQQQQHQMQPVPVPPPGLETFSSQVKLRETSPVDSSTSVGKMLQLPSLSLDSQAMAAQQTHQQKHIKPQKRRIPPTSKRYLQNVLETY